jgi:peptide deformylase
MRGFVERPNKIRMKWRDENFTEHDEIIEGYRAIVLQHECDHLFGVLYVDRLKSTSYLVSMMTLIPQANCWIKFFSF